jgi:hypothetical protein
MPLSLPNLDDRTFDDLVEEALAMLPRYAPGWTNHNPSDPGITLVELLAYFVEHFIYRLNRVTKDTRIRFLQLLTGAAMHDASRWQALSAEEVDQRLRQAVLDVRRPQRAVTAEDYERLAREATVDTSATARIVRARSFARRNLEGADDRRRDEDAPGHISVVAVPAGEAGREAGAALVARVREYLEPRRLLAARLHVVEPFFLWISLGARIHLRADAGPQAVLTASERAAMALQEFGSPLPGGGPQGEGWPFGRALYLSEVYQRLEQVDGVDYVDAVDVLGVSTREGIADERTRIGIKVGRSIVGVDAWLGTSPEHGTGRVLVDAEGRLVGIALRPYELLRIVARVEDMSAGEASRAPRATVEPAGPPAPTPGDEVTEPRSEGPEPEPAGGELRSVRPVAEGSADRATKWVAGRLLAHLPRVYHDSPDLRDLVSVFEGVLFGPHERALDVLIAQIATMFDVVRAPRELPGWESDERPGWVSERRDAFVPWLAHWVALSGPLPISVERQRQLVGRIVPLYAWRGTRRYVTELLEFYLPENARIRVEDGEFAGFEIGRSRIGIDAWLEHDRPFWFKVMVLLPDPAAGREGDTRGPVDWETLIRQIIDLAKPAHTTYDLELAASPAAT